MFQDILYIIIDVLKTSNKGFEIDGSLRLRHPFVIKDSFYLELINIRLEYLKLQQSAVE